MKFFTFFSLLLISSMLNVLDLNAQGSYVTGDFHQHSTYTDGSYTIGYMMQNNANYGLDWWANSEHGGSFNRWGLVSGAEMDEEGTEVTWAEAGITILGDNDGEKMFRWQSLKDWSFTDIQLWRRILTDKLIIQGYEMNVPGHEHGSVAIIGEQFNEEGANVNALAEFEYKFDESDADISGGASMGWIKSALSGHEKTLEAIEWLETNYQDQS